MKDKKIYFLTIGETGYSRSWTYFEGLSEIQAHIEFIHIDSKKIIQSFRALRKKTLKTDTFFVMFPSHFLVPYVRFFLGKNVYLDAGWSLFEGTIISRRRLGIIGSNIAKAYVIDFMASLFAKKIILESHAQKQFYCKLFFVKKSKCSVIYTGVSESQFKCNPDFKTPPDFFGNSNIVLFRGKYTAEAGLEVLAETTKILASEKITFWVFSPQIPEQIEFSKSTFVLNDFINSKSDIAKLYCKASLTLGQLSDHTRLRRTIPHKAYESAFLAKPYLTARTNGILEVFTENKDVLCFIPGDAFDLAIKIKKFFDDSRNYKKLGTNMKAHYDLNLSQKKLAVSLAKLLDA